MEDFKRSSYVLAAVLWGCTATAVWAGDEHGEDGVVGVNPAFQLALEFAKGTTFELPEVSGLINGWALDDPGFLSLEEDEPSEDFFVLDPAALIALEVISLDPAFKAYTPGFADTLDTPGDTWEIGSPFFDEHPTWHIDSDDPLFDPEQSVWTGTFRMLDLGTTGYSASEPFTLSFLPVPEPTLLGLVGCVSVLFVSQRTSRRSGR